MTILTILLAFLAGIVSFASPCCLPLVPAYLSYMVGTSGRQHGDANDTIPARNARRMVRMVIASLGAGSSRRAGGGALQVVGDRLRQGRVGVDRDDLLPLCGHLFLVRRGLAEVQETKVVVHLSHVGVELRGDQPLLLGLDRIAKVELPGTKRQERHLVLR